MEQIEQIIENALNKAIAVADEMKYKKYIHIYHHSVMNEKQMKNAVERIAPGCNESDIVICCDLTVGGSCKNGVLFSKLGLYGKEFGYLSKEPYPVPILYNSIKSIHNAPHSSLLFVLNDGTEFVIFGSSYVMFLKEILLNIIQELNSLEQTNDIEHNNTNDIVLDSSANTENNDTNNDTNIIELTDENGNPAHFEILDLITYEGCQYVVLIPASPDVENDGNVIILQLISNDDNTESYIPVKDDDIVASVYGIFKEHFQGMFEFADDNSSSTAPLPYTGEAPYIFISYSHKDDEQVWKIIKRLQNDGYRVWYDEGIDPGSEWDDNIATHIENCGCMISFISESYLDSDNCKDEMNYARDLSKNRILVYIDDVKLNGGLAMRWNRLQALYFFKYPIKDLFFRKLYASKVLTISNVHNDTI
jgi:uncharacterized protein YrzB (UPF0473 family)